MKRRTFLNGLALMGLQGVALRAGAAVTAADGLAAETMKSAKEASDADKDENLVVLISDLHTNPTGYQPGRLARTVADIVAMRPLPANVIALGDLAYLEGKPEEYALLRQLLKPITDAGITLTMTMGNHDRRRNFKAAFPELAAKTQMDRYMNFIVSTPRADFILIDSLQEGPNGEFIVPGKVEDDQREWLTSTAKAYTKPFFVCAHHPIYETAVGPMLMDTKCCGYIHGHDHVWRTGWQQKNWSDERILPTLCLPSTGHWGDIGYTVMNLNDNYAEAVLHQYEFFFPTPRKDESVPRQWRLMTENHQGLTYHFVY